VLTEDFPPHLPGKAEQEAHAKSYLNCRERNNTQLRRSRLSQPTGATGVGISSSIRVAYSASARDQMDLGWNENVSQLYLDPGDPRDRSGGMSLTTTAGTTARRLDR
jgi:hypothetical protein